MGDMVRIELGVGMGIQKNTDVVECPRTEWDAMTYMQREDWMQGALDVHVSNNIDAWYRELDGED
jgi:hypothetical protein